MTIKKTNKNLVFDLDGTLLDSKKNIPDGTFNFLKSLKNTNIFMATGRAWYFTLEYHQKLGLHTPIISSNGSLVYDPVLKKVLSSKTFKQTTSVGLINLLFKENIPFFVLSPTQMYSYEPKGFFSEKIDEVNKMNLSFLPENRFVMDPLNRDEWDASIEVIKIVLTPQETDPEIIRKVMDEIDQNYGDDAYHVLPEADYLDIMPFGLSKGTGLKYLEKLGYLDLTNTTVFGDALNDVPMFKEAKTSVAMPQASEEVKKLATYAAEHEQQGNSIQVFLEKHPELWDR
ncbi:Cof-type HAD-IIB family hydrolase [[Mycoplasma] testudinis]|uniref:Cof-type HAD-IIB family hydrolase n=1 Tax=[Mycoplasma] testudinis TaxID=33924 RepID=UPI00048336BB|nr:Cof-type HAD-IIB family hydrolase [[Mycoplasma] testudinis]